MWEKDFSYPMPLFEKRQDGTFRVRKQGTSYHLGFVLHSVL